MDRRFLSFGHIERTYRLKHRLITRKAKGDFTYLPIEVNGAKAHIKTLPRAFKRRGFQPKGPK